MMLLVVMMQFIKRRMIMNCKLSLKPEFVKEKLIMFSDEIVSADMELSVIDSSLKLLPSSSRHDLSSIGFSSRMQ